MRNPRLDRHSQKHHELFDENTAQVGSLGDIVEKHAGDAVFLGPSESGVGGADGGEEDFISEMNETDPAGDEDLDPEDTLEDGLNGAYFTADQTGTVAGIARGFGSHLTQDLGRDGFQIEEMPDIALSTSRISPDGELDDYDSPDESDMDDQSPELARASEPGTNPARRRPATAQPHQYVTHDPRPRSTDDELDATREIK